MPKRLKVYGSLQPDVMIGKVPGHPDVNPQCINQGLND